MSAVTVLVADDHTIIRSGLRHLIEREPDLQVVGEAANGREAIDLAQRLRPDVVILDITMPKLNGIDAGKQIIANVAKTRVIILSMHSDEGYVLKALRAGARGYLLKDSAESDIINAIRAVSAGKAYFSPEISRMLADDYVRQLQQRGVEDSYELLSLREREVLQLLAEGKSNKEIATMLKISPHTIETHRSNIFEKLNLHSLPELILYAVRKGAIH
jgi:two-component system response regulator NreC